MRYVFGWDILVEWRCRGPSGHYLLSFAPYVVVGCVGTGYVLRVELPVQRRLCPILVRDVGSPDIHECFRGLEGS